ncbi:unnamed protein product [Chondrus crispus]|uniref:Protoporphyrinogen oxidase n=1 Tax=Chondrus crispus TaxID=2769 RepID=R7QDH7_CHOCR|nr:unnamed protein product [Chondrus crispus]CDF36567.1 unnamed protein product [Chondrus crispus]|eukprot:XP_005716386.1 unnamed protein product [Chondrus crispus]
MPEPVKRNVAVLGGGPAGLSAAFRLLHDLPPGLSVKVDLYEATGRLGGAVTSACDAGFCYELGPNSMNAKHPSVADLIQEKLRLKPRMLPRSPYAKRYYFMRDGKLVPLPLSPLHFATTGLLSWRAKWHVVKEPFVARLQDVRDSHMESVASFFQRRFGREVVDYLVDPMVAGTYSGKPADLSMKHALRKVWRLEQKHGSVIGALLRGAGKTKPDPRYKPYTGKELRASFTYDKGMEVVTDALVANINDLNPRGGRLYTHGKVRTLDRDPNGAWRINGRGKYDAVISTIPTHAVKSIYTNMSALGKGFKKLNKSIKYAPVSVVVMGFDKSQVPHPLDGFGALIPTVEGRQILGINFSSSNYPQRLSDPDKVFLTVYVGGQRNPDLPFRRAKEIVDISKKELGHVLGVKGDPFFSRVKTWKRGIPQYDPQFDESLCTMARAEKSAKGFVFGGNYRDGVGLPDALRSGILSAEKTLQYLKTL